MVLQKLATPTTIESCVIRSNISKNQTCTPFLRKMAPKYWTTIQSSFLNKLHNANYFNNGFAQLPDYKVPVIIKNNNFTFCLGKSRENVVNIFQDFPGFKNKIQGLSRTAKKIQDFSRMWQPWNVLCRIDTSWAINQKILPGQNRVNIQFLLEHFSL